jgi:hypothetical protein
MSTWKVVIASFVLLLLLEESTRLLQTLTKIQPWEGTDLIGRDGEKPTHNPASSGGLGHHRTREVGEKPTLYFQTNDFVWKGHTMRSMVSLLSRTMEVVVEDNNPHQSDSLFACFAWENYYPADPPARSGIFHWADEQGDLWKGLPYAEAAFIIRNYYFPEIWEAFPGKIVWIPNGHIDGLMDGIVVKPVLERTRNCSWLGSYSPELEEQVQRTKGRTHMMEVLNPSQICLIEISIGFLGNRQSQDYAQFVLDSKFTLCPWGNNKETIRLYDALEIGSIPILLSGATFVDYVLSVVPGHPFVIIEDWIEVAGVLEHYEMHPDQLVAQQAHSLEWWNQFQEANSWQIRDLIFGK